MPERTDHNEAMRLADRISPETDWYEFDQVTWCNEAAALLRQQAERIAELEAERDQLRAEVERLKPNAERYQWLADCENFYEAICLIANPSLTAHDLGTAIDAARTTHKETE